MRKKFIFVIVLLFVILFSGCTNQLNNNGNTPPQYSDNALALVDYKARINVYQNEETWIDFWLTNQVENDVTNVKVKLFNPNVFNVTKMICPGYDPSDNSCNIGTISSLQAIRVQIFLKAPSKEKIGTLEDSYKVDLSVNYDYEGESNCYFRILNLDRESTKTKMQKTQSKGPVHVDIEPGFLIEEKTDKGTRTISDWAIAGKSFNVEISTENVGGLGSGYTYPEITMSSFNLNLYNIQARDQGVCDLDITTLTKNDVIVPTKNPLTCILTPLEVFSEPEIPAMMNLKYSYTYKFIKIETFKIETV
jgi:hypothetical protein